MSWESNSNFVNQVMAFPCAKPNPIIIALTFLPAVLPALLDYAGMTCRDIMKARLGHQAPCGRMLHGQFAKAIPPELKGFTGTLLKFEAALSRIGNYWLIADLISDTAARWTSLAYKLSGCPDIFEGAAWQIRPGAPQALLAGVPTILGGLIRDEVGQPGIAWPTGAVVPAKWYFSSEFSAKAKAFREDRPVEITIYLHQGGTHPYDFPGHHTPPTYGWMELSAHDYQEAHNQDEHNPTQYTYMGIADETCLMYEFTATCQATPFPQIGFGLEPLACFKDLTNPLRIDPAGRNYHAKLPTAVAKFVKDYAPAPRRGPPKGKPRTIN